MIGKAIETIQWVKTRDSKLCVIFFQKKILPKASIIVTCVIQLYGDLTYIKCLEVNGGHFECLVQPRHLESKF